MVKKQGKVYAFTNSGMQTMLKEEKRPLQIWIVCLALALVGTAIGWVVS